jgi:hypothetical protein
VLCYPGAIRGEERRGAADVMARMGEGRRPGLGRKKGRGEVLVCISACGYLPASDMVCKVVTLQG